MEKPPKISDEDMLKTIVIQSRLPEKLTSLIAKINDSYEYWDAIKYKKLPAGYTPNNLWCMVKADRLKSMVHAWPKYGVHFSLTNKMQRQCHEFDMNFGGSWESGTTIPEKHKERYLISSLMEEAISSSQMEGAVTTRKVAKEMLRKKILPKDRSQQMIFNNYQTIQYIVANKEKPLTAELLLQIHLLMTDKTMENPDDAGRFRLTDDVVVENGITHEVVHTPPSFKEIPAFIKDLCAFFNNDDAHPFIHPIIKGLIIHFMVAYMHPFVDGNGRTARALFYWYMLKQGYWLTEYLSISRIIYHSKASYENSFLHTEADGNDMGYFIAYNLHVLERAFAELQLYIKRKIDERKVATSYLKIKNVNERQAEIIKILHDNPSEMLTIKHLQAKFLISPTTAKSDIEGLLARGILEEIHLNKVKRGYIKGANFDDAISDASL